MTHLCHFISSTDKKSIVKSAKSCLWISFNICMSDFGQLSYANLYIYNAALSALFCVNKDIIINGRSGDGTPIMYGEPPDDAIC